MTDKGRFERRGPVPITPQMLEAGRQAGARIAIDGKLLRDEWWMAVYRAMRELEPE